MHPHVPRFRPSPTRGVAWGTAPKSIPARSVCFSSAGVLSWTCVLVLRARHRMVHGALWRSERRALTFTAARATEKREGGAAPFPASQRDYAESRRAEFPLRADFGLLWERKAAEGASRLSASAVQRWRLSGARLEPEPLTTHDVKFKAPWGPWMRNLTTNRQRACKIMVKSRVRLGPSLLSEGHRHSSS